MTAGNSQNQYHLAQVNIAKMKGSYDDPVMAEFVSRLDEINSLADTSPGFVWRLQTEEGDATALRVFDDPLVLINLSVWQSIEALGKFVYQTNHRQLVRGRADWFHPMNSATLALWWIPAGHLPTADEAKARLNSIDNAGPTAYAFTFASRFPPPSTNSD